MNLAAYVYSKVEEVKEELPSSEYLYLFNVAPTELEDKVKAAFDEIMKQIDIIQEVQDDCYEI